MKFLRKLLVFILIVIVFGGAAVWIIYYFKNIEKKELTYELRKNTNGSYAELEKGFTHYELDGPDSGKVILLLNGFSVPYYIWNGTYEYLTSHGFRVLRYDMYGRGFSDRPNATYNKQLYFEQLNELIDQLHLKQPFNIAGVSFGGLMAADYAAAYPEKVNKVVLIDPAYNFDHPSTPELAENFLEALDPEKRALSQMEDFKYPDKHPNWVDQYRPQMEYKGFRHALVSTRYNYGSDNNKIYTALNNAHKQVLLIWGKDDKTVPFTYSKDIQQVLKTEFLPVDDAAHLPHLEQPDVVNPALVTFLKK
ncbi:MULTISPECIES: alpha/beta fold hydrolase [unclassified Mucilaginibacter]|uniref:alpha/beta fold hydrolase n=1 Tax=unclassified Mucilaginibacter TaxID=2617802 RepID=UPI00095CDB86|nr:MULTISPECIES: alpha/beta hydrolase [unclassified Mucilaginibacter]OJW14778.1 MAG: hypothetical protein BGO48_11385 [Mucilaginibacter sp. 44-25]PLW90087.1 MAG: hypothetical protein C0154_08125 [Mucilaginibacter sp.]HEK21992.1 alpha/beta hydrolase [Bacteroidota bacterium]